jgi:hypothetical protein
MSASDLMLLRRFAATPQIPAPNADTDAFRQRIDEVCQLPGVEALQLVAPVRGPKEGESDFIIRSGLFCVDAAGATERLAIDRTQCDSAALAAVVEGDIEALRQEGLTPRRSLKPYELREVVRTDASGRETREFYGEHPSVWMDAFKPPLVKFVSGGSQGIATPDSPQLRQGYTFSKDDLPEIQALRRQQAYADSAEFKVIKAYADAGKTPPPEVLAKVRSA